jgi:hypothetical protein
MCPSVEEYKEVAKKSKDRFTNMSRIQLNLWKCWRERCYKYQSVRGLIMPSLLFGILNALIYSKCLG